MNTVEELRHIVNRLNGLIANVVPRHDVITKRALRSEVDHLDTIVTELEKEN